MIKHPFILRFQEFCTGTAASEPGSGTQTLTNIRAEELDSDNPRRKLDAFATGVASGTQTHTFVVSEKGDNDPHKPKHDAFSSGQETNTLSITAVRAEAVDEDKSASATSAFPKEKSAISAGTQTHTRVQAEQSDDDRGSKEFLTIPRCSLS